MMKSIVSLLFLLVSVSAFMQPIPAPAATSLQMGLFDGVFGKKDEPKKKMVGGMDANVFGGKGKKITVREDEDNAMWVEDPKDKKPKKGK